MQRDGSWEVRKGLCPRPTAHGWRGKVEQAQRARQEGGQEGLRTSPGHGSAGRPLGAPPERRLPGWGQAREPWQKPSVLARLGFLAQAVWADHNSGRKSGSA